MFTRMRLPLDTSGQIVLLMPRAWTSHGATRVQQKKRAANFRPAAFVVQQVRVNCNVGLMQDGVINSARMTHIYVGRSFKPHRTLILGVAAGAYTILARKSRSAVHDSANFADAQCKWSLLMRTAVANAISIICILHITQTPNRQGRAALASRSAVAGAP
eukprot:6212760-Pleurochrysis_carterae.AAC.2